MGHFIKYKISKRTRGNLSVRGHQSIEKVQQL
jgi:hypothetical protein